MPRIDDIKMPGAMSMNLDVDLSLLPEKFYRVARNFRNGVSSEDNLFAGEAVMGNTIKQELSPFVTINGRYPDIKTNSIYLFLCQTVAPNSSIYRYNILEDTVESIFIDEELNFSPDHRINHIDLVDGTLYWTNKYNAPRKLNVIKAYNYTHGVNVSPLLRYFKYKPRTTDRVIHILDQIIHPPLYSPTKFVGTDSSIEFVEGYGRDVSLNYNLVRDSLWQFRYRYVYDEHQKSVWSPCSKVFFDNLTELANGIFQTDSTVNNVIGVQLNTGTEEVNYIEVAYRIDKTGKWQLADRIYKYDTAGNVLISSEINYVFKFYNNSQSEALDQLEVNRDFHLVPKLSGAMAVIEKNRLVHANVLEGSDSITPDIALTLKFNKILDSVFSVTIPITLLSETWNTYYVDMPLITYPNSVYIININRLGTDDNWTAQVLCGEDDTPTTMRDKLKDALLKLSYIYYGDYALIILFYTVIPPTTPYGFYFNYTVTNPPNWEIKATGIINLDSITYRSFKAGSWQEFGLRYFDRGGRACSVSTNDSCKVFIPYYPTLYRDKLIIGQKPIDQIMMNWEINHIPTQDAVTYRWYRKKNSIEYHLSFYISEQNIRTIGTTTYLIVNPIINSEMLNVWKKNVIEQYVWQKGDRIRMYAYRLVDDNHLLYLSEEFDFEILGVDYSVYDTVMKGYLMDDSGDFVYDDFGNKVRDIAKESLIIDNFRLPFPFTDDQRYIYYFEIYRNRKELGDEDSQFWYEFSEEFPIINPGTEQRYHGKGYDDGSNWARNQGAALSARGTFVTGDIYIKIRNSILSAFPVESQWYSDFFLSNLNDDGKVSIINKEYREKWFPNTLRFGGLYIQESFVNELTAFIGGDIEIISEKFGEINLIKEFGYTLKVRCANKIISIYIGRAGLQQAGVDAQGGELLVASDRLLGTQYIPNETYGCLNPESEVAHGNDNYFIDIFKGHIVRESKNGLMSISKKYQIHNWTKATCEYLYNECDNVRVVGGFSEDYDELYFTFYGTNKITKAVFAETVIFYDPEEQEGKGWKCFVDLKDAEGYPPDSYISVGKKFFSFLKGFIAQQDSNSLYCNFFGVQYYPNINFVFNKEVYREKVYRVLSYDGEQQWHCPDAGDIKIPASYGNTEMWSQINIQRIKSIKGIKYSDFGRNMLSTSNTPNLKDLVTGQELRGRLLLVNLVGINPAKSFLRWIKTESVISELTG